MTKAIPIVDDFLQAGLEVSRSLFSQENLGRHYVNRRVGMKRAGYSPQEKEAIQIVLTEAQSLGLELYQDLAGNVFFIYAGIDRRKPVKLFASHVDAVAKGGMYDGVAGVVSTLAAMKILREAGLTPPQDSVGGIWRCEESPAFGQFGIGSALATGVLTSISEYRNKAKERLSDLVMRSYFATEREAEIRRHDLFFMLDHNKILFPKNAVAEVLEFHIEQCDSLLLSGKSLGIATSIRGNVRMPDIQFYGKAQHTGGGVMSSRQDTSLMDADFKWMSKRLFDQLLRRKRDIVFTYPATKYDNSDLTTTKAHTRLAVEARSIDPEVLAVIAEALPFMAQRAAKANNGQVDCGKIKVTQPTHFKHPMLGDSLLNLAASLGIPAQKIISGAGHDIMRLDTLDIPSVLILMRHDGLSHNPCEIMTCRKGEDPFVVGSDYANAVKVAAYCMMAEPYVPTKRRASFVKNLVSRGAMKISM